MNKRYDSRKPLISVHVPKCGGSSFRSVLKQWFGDDLYLHYASEKNNTMPPKYELGAGSCVHGHFNKARDFGVEQYYPDVDQRITILRDPLEVAISGYFYKLKRIEAGTYFRDGEIINTPELSLEKHLTEKPSNYFKFFPFNDKEDEYRSILDDYFLYIGILEDIEKTICDVSRILEKPYIAPEHNNSAPRTVIVPEKIAARFRLQNRRAFEIYDYARERFERNAP